MSRWYTGNEMKLWGKSLKVLAMAILVGIMAVFLSVREPGIVDEVANTVDTVVLIEQMNTGAVGSGFVVSSDGLIVTARHVIQGGNRFKVLFENGDSYLTGVAISSKDSDIGFLKIDAQHLKSAKIGVTSECRRGEQVYTIGSPFGRKNINAVSTGIVSGVNRSYVFSDWNGNSFGWEVAFTTSAPGHPGNSGGPIFNMDEEVVGVLVGGSSPVLIYCMPIDLISGDFAEIRLMLVTNKYRFGGDSFCIEDEIISILGRPEDAVPE